MAVLVALAVVSGLSSVGFHDAAALEALAADGAGGVVGGDAANLVAWVRPAYYDKSLRLQPPLPGGPGGGDGATAPLPVPPVCGAGTETRLLGSGDVSRHAAASGLFTRRVPTAPPSRIL